MVKREYTCTRCHHDWDAFQPEGDEHIRHCPWCEKPSARLVKEMGNRHEQTA